MNIVNWKSINRLRFGQLYPDLLAFYQNGTLPSQKGKSAITRFKQHTRTFTWDAKEKKIYLITDNAPQGEALDGIAKLPIKLELLNPNNEGLIQDIIVDFFNHPIAGGYRGLESTFAKLKQQYLGITREMVSQVLKKLELKQIRRKANVRELHPILSSRPMERLQIDLVDVHQFAGSNNGIKYLLNVVDHFSKFAWSIPIKHKNKEIVSNRLVELFLKEGFPQILQADNGGEFKNWVLHTVASDVGIEIKHSEPYNSSTQGLVERFNGTVRYYIHSHQVNKQTKRFIDVLPYFVYSYNSTPHKSTKFTPFEIHRRKQEVFNIDKIVQKNLKKNSQQMKKRFSKNITAYLPVLEEGSFVRVDTTALKETRKLSQIDRERMRKHRELNNFTTQIYLVVEVKEFPQDETVEGEEQKLVKKYSLEPVEEEKDSHAVIGKFFFRESLLKVNSAEMIPVQGSEAFGGKDIKVDVANYGLDMNELGQDLQPPTEADLADLSWELDEKHIDTPDKQDSWEGADEVEYSSDSDNDDNKPTLPLGLQEGRPERKKKLPSKFKDFIMG